MMGDGVRSALGALCLAAALVIGCARPAVAQGSGAALAPAVRQRVEALLRSRMEFPPATTLTFTLGGPSEVSGFRKLSAHYASSFAGSSGEVSLLLSDDGARLAELTTFDIAADPRTRIPFAGRPSRGGSAAAPVLIVGFDDLECPFCARLHQSLFPALLDRYKDQVQIVYQGLPSEGHPWAMHAAIDTDCLAQQSAPAYWAAVDEIHRHAPEYGGTERKLAVADAELDTEASEQGRRFHLDEDRLKGCIEKQDPAPEKASIALAAKLGVETTPTLFINGARTVGAVPIDFIFDLVDNALRAEGQVPPPREAPAAPPSPIAPAK